MGTRCRPASAAAVLLVAATAVLAGGLLPAGPAAAAEEPVRNLRWFGYNEDWLSNPARIDLVTAGGANVVRSVVSWRIVERRPGEYRWHRYDQLYERMAAGGARPLWVLADAPCWAWAPSKRECREQGRIAHPPSPEHDGDWAAFAAHLVARYPGTAAVESWNEPNLAAFFKPAPDPARAAVVTAWANLGVDLVDESIPVILGGPSPSFHTVPGNEIAYDEFIRGAYAAVGTDHWDGVGMHPFPSLRRQGHYLRDIHAHLNTVSAVTREAGVPATPIWVTEVGLSTRGIRPYSAKEQAVGLRRIHQGLARRDDISIPALIVHRLVDQDAGFRAAPEAGWGVVRQSGTAKPAFCELARVRGDRCPLERGAAIAGIP